ncbi:MAG TPA: hypothetical protein VES60_10440 [Nakamurella sp.]|nr:hypothetical protein [Nakamurella sp.]
MAAEMFEFVVLGVLGPHLRSMLADLDIDDRPSETVLFLRDSDESVLLSLLARIAADDLEVQAIRCVTAG